MYKKSCRVIEDHFRVPYGSILELRKKRWGLLLLYICTPKCGKGGVAYLERVDINTDVGGSFHQLPSCSHADAMPDCYPKFDLNAISHIICYFYAIFPGF